ncbi:hypothetical protein T265_07273 [Opisthorchis viverrini]|uniref:Uncharacterized protein n=1 Tax=Opisthorchis viverrini TaxID=6198 RepID=A0A075AC25_OPIVI|nr:hypothetical protein T265_07273 [Opisthorchis viverrini]KER25234.1 hypothetical protein T265_07273 [Opisthorchis viverrini]
MEDPCFGPNSGTSTAPIGAWALVLPSGGMAARHRKGVTAERLQLLPIVNLNQKQLFLFLSSNTTLHLTEIPSKFGLGSISCSRKASNWLGRSQVFYGYTVRSALWCGSALVGARWPKWLEREFTDRKALATWRYPNPRANFGLRVRGSNPTSASRLPLSRLGRTGSIPALLQPSGGRAARHRKDATVKRFSALVQLCGSGAWTGRSVVRTGPLSLDFPRLGLGNMAVSQPSCFLRVAWQLGTKRVLQLNKRQHTFELRNRSNNSSTPDNNS